MKSKKKYIYKNFSLTATIIKKSSSGIGECDMKKATVGEREEDRTVCLSHHVYLSIFSMLLYAVDINSSLRDS